MRHCVEYDEQEKFSQDNQAVVDSSWHHREDGSSTEMKLVLVVEIRTSYRTTGERKFFRHVNELRGGQPT